MKWSRNDSRISGITELIYLLIHLKVIFRSKQTNGNNVIFTQNLSIKSKTKEITHYILL